MSSIRGALVLGLWCVLVCHAAETPAARVDRYLQMLDTLTPAQRGELLAWLAAWRERAAAPGEAETLRDPPTRHYTFWRRLGQLRGRLEAECGGRAVADRLVLERVLAPGQAGRRLDRAILDFTEGRPVTLESVRATLPRLAPAPGVFKLYASHPLTAMGEVRAALDRGPEVTEWKLEVALRDMHDQLVEDAAPEPVLAAMGEALIHRAREADDAGLAHVLLAASAWQGATDDTGTARQRALAGLAAQMAGREAEARRLVTAAANATPIEPEVHYWCALGVGCDRATGAADRFLAHLHALATVHFDRKYLPELVEAGPCLDVFQRGIDVAIAMVAEGNRASPAHPLLRRAWAAAVSMDAAPLAALELAVRHVLEHRAANLAIPGDERSVRDELTQLHFDAAAALSDLALSASVTRWPPATASTRTQPSCLADNRPARGPTSIATR